MKTPSFILSVLLLLFSQEAIAQIVTRYSYDESGNVVSRRDIGNASHKSAKNISVADTASFANIYYDNNNCTLTIKLNNTTLGAATNVNIYNATTRLKISSFSFIKYQILISVTLLHILELINIFYYGRSRILQRVVLGICSL